MNSLPPAQRGAGAGMLATFNELGERPLDRRLLHADDRRPRRRPAAHDAVRPRRARRRRRPTRRASPHLPPVSTLFAAFLGYNPIETLLGPHVLHGSRAGECPDADRPRLLPAPHLEPVPHRARLRLRVRDRRLPGRRGRVAAARRQVRPRRGGRGRIRSTSRWRRERRRQPRSGSARSRARRRDAAHDPLLRGARPARLRHASGRRARTALYAEADVARLQELIRLRDLLGLTLEELVELAEAEEARAALRGRWEEDPSDEERLRIVEEAIPHVERQLALVRSRQRDARRVRRRARGEARAPPRAGGASLGR